MDLRYMSSRGLVEEFEAAIREEATLTHSGARCRAGEPVEISQPEYSQIELLRNELVRRAGLHSS